MKHKITLREMDFESKTRIAGAHGERENKSLDLIVNPALDRKWYVVTDNRNKTTSCSSLETAVEAYNNL